MRILSFLFLLCLSLRLDGQDQADTRQTMVLQMEPFGWVISEPIEKGMTLFSISKRYQVPIDSILKANSDLDVSAVPLGYGLIIPINKRQIVQQIPDPAIPSIPLSYRVQPKETLYRISKTYLNSHPDELRVLNPQLEDGLHVGQVLHIGWYIPSKQQEAISSSSLHINEISQLPVKDYAEEYEAEGKKIMEQKGLAIWKPGSQEGHYFVLHPTAKVGSFMQVTNPMLHRTLTAKVAGKLTPGLYPSHVGLIVSPSLAKALGVLDQQFFARWRFVE